jgi:thiol-disulfide isomerase/thioredoxin
MGRTSKRRTAKRSKRSAKKRTTKRSAKRRIAKRSAKSRTVRRRRNTKMIGGSADALTLNLYHMKGCGHCTRLQPIWEQLKQKLENENKGMHINSYDVTVPSQAKSIPADIRGFPTIRLYKGNTLVAEYDGDRNVKDMYNWLCKYNFNDLSCGSNNMA